MRIGEEVEDSVMATLELLEMRFAANFSGWYMNKGSPYYTPPPFSLNFNPLFKRNESLLSSREDTSFEAELEYDLG